MYIIHIYVLITVPNPADGITHIQYGALFVWHLTKWEPLTYCLFPKPCILMLETGQCGEQREVVQEDACARSLQPGGHLYSDSSALDDFIDIRKQW